jgi:hypothetical protein
MNQYTELIYYFKALLEADPLVNTVTQGDADEMALNKMDVFMLCHINVGDAIFTNGQTVGFNCEITCLDIIDHNLEQTEDKFFKNNNEVDVYNETLAVLNRFWSNVHIDFEEKGIKAPENATLEKGALETKDNAVGWKLPFSVELPNRKLNLS